MLETSLSSTPTVSPAFPVLQSFQSIIIIPIIIHLLFNVILTTSHQLSIVLSFHILTLNCHRYGVVTPHEEELGLHLDNLARCTQSITLAITLPTLRWGINVFKISELSNNRPLTAVAYTVFHERDLINQFKIPPTSLLSLLLTLEEHYLTEVPSLKKVTETHPPTTF